MNLGLPIHHSSTHRISNLHSRSDLHTPHYRFKKDFKFALKLSRNGRWYSETSHVLTASLASSLTAYRSSQGHSKQRDRSAANWFIYCRNPYTCLSGDNYWASGLIIKQSSKSFAVSLGAAQEDVACRFTRYCHSSPYQTHFA